MVNELRLAVANCQNASVDLINYRKDKTSYWISLSIVPIFNKKKNCTHFIGITQDITDRKLAGLAMQKANDDLLEKNKQIYEIAMINSHIIRKPVANIMGAISLIDKSTVDNVELLELIEIIEISINEMDNLIRAIGDKTEPGQCLHGLFFARTNCVVF